MSGRSPSLSERRVLITGAARGIGAALARRLHDRGARVALAGLEPHLLASVANDCGDAPWSECDVTRRENVEASARAAVDALGGLDVVVANAGIAAQTPLVGGDPAVFERIIEVNVLGTYYTLRAAGPYISHPRGYALAIASLAAAVHLPLLGAYSASKAAVEALGDTLSIELGPSGARAGVAYFSELDTDMTRRGFATNAGAVLTGGRTAVSPVTPLKVAIDALERGIARRSRRIVAPRWVGAVLPVRMAARPVVDRYVRRRMADALRAAREEHPPLTTPQPDREGH